MNINLKAPMPPEKCAKYLSDALGEEITAQDVLHQIAQDRLAPSWHVQGLHAQRVAPVSVVRGRYEDYEAGERGVLSGVLRVDVERNPAVREWAQAAAFGKDPAMFTPAGVILEEGDGSLWQALTNWGPGYDDIPLPEPLPIADLVIQQRDADDLVRGLRGTQHPEPATAAPNQPATEAKLTWPEQARAIADEIDAIDAKGHAHDSISSIANRVAEEMRARGIAGPRGPLTGNTVMREALQGGKWKRKR